MSYEERNNARMLTADCRCSTCDRKGRDIYRMVGVCTNCGATPVLVLNSVGHKADAVSCPICQNRTVIQKRLATDDEIPEAADSLEER